MTTGTTTKSSTKAKMRHKLIEPAKTVDMVPALKHKSLMNASKFADAKYITVLMPEEILVYDEN